MRVQFGGFLFDGARRELLRGKRTVQLSPKAFLVLEVLVTKVPAAVSKEELCEVLWPDVFVQEANLKNLVSEVRRALGEDARKPRYLRTVHRFGYAFRPEGDSAPAGCFRVTHLARDFELQPGENILGRDSEASVVISMKSISRRHARIVVSGDTVMLEDLGSKNGTWLRGRRIAEPTEINDGDEIRLGSVPLVFRAASAGSTETDIAE